MIRCASGSIHVVTNVARLRCGSPSMTRSPSSNLMASVAAIPSTGKVSEGAGTVRKRLPNRAATSLLVMPTTQSRPEREPCADLRIGLGIHANGVPSRVIDSSHHM